MKQENRKTGSAQITTDHQIIRKWTEERGGIPVTVTSTKTKGEVGLLRIKFPEVSKDTKKLEEISWEEFFKKFDENKLQFLYQEKTKDGEISRFFKFVSSV